MPLSVGVHNANDVDAYADEDFDYDDKIATAPPTYATPPPPPSSSFINNVVLFVRTLPSRFLSSFMTSTQSSASNNDDNDNDNDNDIDHDRDRDQAAVDRRVADHPALNRLRELAQRVLLFFRSF